jgi:hypothetical protein
MARAQTMMSASRNIIKANMPAMGAPQATMGPTAMLRVVLRAQTALHVKRVGARVVTLRLAV